MDQDSPDSPAGQDPDRPAAAPLIGREALIDEVVREIRKGKHVVLTGPVGIGKSALLRGAQTHRAAALRVAPVRPGGRGCRGAGDRADP